MKFHSRAIHRFCLFLLCINQLCPIAGGQSPVSALQKGMFRFFPYPGTLHNCDIMKSILSQILKQPFHHCGMRRRPLFGPNRRDQIGLDPDPFPSVADPFPSVADPAGQIRRFQQFSCHFFIFISIYNQNLIIFQTIFLLTHQLFTACSAKETRSFTSSSVPSSSTARPQNVPNI